MPKASRFARKLLRFSYNMYIIIYCVPSNLNRLNVYLINIIILFDLEKKTKKKPLILYNRNYLYNVILRSERL